MKLDGKKVGFLGDSITEGCCASSVDKCFVSLFANAHPECATFNYGIGGTRIAPNKIDEIKEFAHPFLERLQVMENDLDLIFVFGGTNDYGHGDAPLGKYGNQDNVSFYGNYYILLKSLMEKYSTSQLVVITPLHRADEEIANSKPDGNHILAEYVKAIKEEAEYFAIPVLDLWSISGIQPTIEINRNTYTADGLHPNDLGYHKLFEIVDRFVKNNI